jgi:hypothetical protein
LCNDNPLKSEKGVAKVSFFPRGAMVFLQKRAISRSLFLQVTGIVDVSKTQKYNQ